MAEKWYLLEWGRQSQVWDMDLIPYIYKQNHISWWTERDEREEMGAGI